jgi:hypothetical protein
MKKSPAYDVRLIWHVICGKHCQTQMFLLYRLDCKSYKEENIQKQVNARNNSKNLSLFFYRRRALYRVSAVLTPVFQVAFFL